MIMNWMSTIINRSQFFIVKENNAGVFNVTMLSFWMTLLVSKFTKIVMDDG